MGGGSLGLRCLVGSAHSGCLEHIVPVQVVSFVHERPSGPGGPPPESRAPPDRLVYPGGRVRLSPGLEEGARLVFLGFRAPLLPCREVDTFPQSGFAI